jgi:hypothetical protein
MARTARWVVGCAVGPLIACAPEPLRLDLDPLRAAGAVTVTLAVAVAGEVDLFVLDLDAPEPTRGLPVWSVDDDEPIRLEAHGYGVPPDIFGVAPGRLRPASESSRPAPPPSLRRARTARAGAPGAWGDVAETEYLEGLRLPPHTGCPRITVTSKALVPRAPRPLALARLADGRWLLSLEPAGELYLLQPTGQRGARVGNLSKAVTALHVQGARIFAGTSTGALYEGRQDGDAVEFRPLPHRTSDDRMVWAIEAGPGTDQLWTLGADLAVRRVDLRARVATVAHSFNAVLDIPGSWLASDESGSASRRALAFSNRALRSLLVMEGERATPTEAPWNRIRGLTHVPKLGFVVAASNRLWRLGPGDFAPVPFAGDLGEGLTPLHIIPVRQGLALVDLGGSISVYLDGAGVVCDSVSLSVRSFVAAAALDPDTLLVFDAGFPLPDDTIQVWTIRLE